MLGVGPGSLTSGASVAAVSLVCGDGLASCLAALFLTSRPPDTAVTVESAWSSALAVRVDGSWRSAANARRWTTARVSGRAMASSSHIRKRLEKNAHMLKGPFVVP
jgi:hypothetical protein